MVMEMAKLDHLIYVLGDHFQEQDFRDQFGNNATFPQVMMGDVHLGGCVDTIKYLTTNKII
jgi:glutaredoxin